MKDKDRILVSAHSNSNSSSEQPVDITKQIDSVTHYTSLGADKNPQLFGGC